MEQPEVKRRLAAILAADMVGYSRLMEADEAGTLARLRTHRLELIDPAIAKNKGRIIKTTGDGMLVEFQSVTEAVLCAVEVQERMGRRNADVDPARWIQFRIGINLGDVIVDGADILGDGVNVAARLETMAEPGGICVSAAVRDQVGTRLELAFTDLGEQRVKNIATPVRAYRVLERAPEASGDGAAALSRATPSARPAASASPPRCATRSAPGSSSPSPISASRRSRTSPGRSTPMPSCLAPMPPPRRRSRPRPPVPPPPSPRSRSYRSPT